VQQFRYSAKARKGPAECDGGDMTLLERQRLGTHHGSVGIEAFDRLPGATPSSAAINGRATK